MVSSLASGVVAQADEGERRRDQPRHDGDPQKILHRLSFLVRKRR
jgi:hypothetical protein